MAHTSKRLLLLVAAVGLAATSCSQGPLDSLSAEERENLEAFVAYAEGEDDIELTAEEETCVLEAIAADDSIIASLDVADPADAPIETQAKVIDTQIDCAPETVRAGLKKLLAEPSDAEENPFPPEAADCIADTIVDSDDRIPLLSSFVRIDTDESVPANEIDAMVDTMTTCVDNAMLAEVVTEEFTSDPATSAATDLDCVAELIDDDFSREFWQVVLENPDDDDAVGEVMSPLLDCMSIGQLFAAQAGGAMSPESVSCLEEMLVGMDITTLVVGGNPSEQLTTALLSCLSQEELLAVAGS